MHTFSKKSLSWALAFFFIIAVTASGVAQNNVKTIAYVRTAKFGKEIVYYGQDDKVLNGTFKIAERSGAYSEANFIDGKPDGKWTGYDSFGKLNYYSTFDNGVGNGKGETYDSNGKVLNTYAYKNGERHGEWTYSSSKGIYKTENYNEGSKEGKWTNTSRDYNGAVTSVAIAYYKSNNPTGKWESKTGDGKMISKKNYSGHKSYSETEYFENGKIKFFKTYAEGKRNGKQESYYKNGFKKDESEYKNGLKIMEKKYHDNGKLGYAATYNQNGPVGVLEKYNQKGIKTRHTVYVDGRLQGVDITYNSKTGNKFVEREYKDDITDGIYKEYYPSGKLLLSGQYIKDQKEGKWKYYSQGGKITRERVFKSNNQVSETKYE